jgi:prevent-host-death family protein
MASCEDKKQASRAEKSLGNPYFPYNIDLVEPKLQGSTSMPSVSVTSADFQKNFGRYRETAIREPVTITNHGRDSLVLLSADEYRRLKSRDREVLLASELSEADLEAMLSAEIPEEAAAFDYELES